MNRLKRCGTYITGKLLSRLNLASVTIWMDLEGIMLSERGQKEKYKYHMISFICGIQKKKNKQKQNK